MVGESSFGLYKKTSTMKKLFQLSVMIVFQILLNTVSVTSTAINKEMDAGIGGELIPPHIVVENDGIFLLAGFSCLTAMLILMAYRSRKPMEVRLMRVVAVILLLISALNVAQGATI